MKKLTYVGLFFSFIGLLGLLALDFRLSARQSLNLTSPDGTPLSATYYPGSVPNGVLLLEGFGSDQSMMRVLVHDLTASGLHVFTFDYSGHGASPGALEYDNASTDRLAGQVQVAMTEFQRISGLDSSQIVWMGHSLGARVALQSSVLGPVSPAKLVLFGAQINLGTNAQSEFFTGTTDSDLDWVQSLGPDNPTTPILLVTGTWEDILTVDAAQALMNKLCGEKTTSCNEGTIREWVLFDKLVHNYEVYSPRVLTVGRTWAFPDMDHPASYAMLRIVLWLSTISGIFLALIGFKSSLRIVSSSLDLGITITDPRKLVLGKLWLWLIALPLSGVIMFLYVLIPLPSPTFNLIYGGFLGGYGLLVFLLYCFGKMPGAFGKLRNISLQRSPMPKGWLLAALFNVGLFVTVALLYRSGIGLVPPVGARFVWVLIFVPLTTLGFWVGMLEADALSVAVPGKSIYRILSLLISLFPFYLYLILLVFLGSISGVIGSLTGLLVLAASMLQGEITRTLTGNSLISAFVQSLLVFCLILPSGALFTPFF
jgi:pimeloyl-ACP methyl ester carboxylesterase